MSSKKTLLVLFIILLTTGILRFYNLMHDKPYFFNPDERNMAAAITQLKLPNSTTGNIQCLSSEFLILNSKFLIPNCNLNPHFFAYGQFPLYLSFVSDQITKPIIQKLSNEPTTYNLPLTTKFDSAIYWLRFWSALASTLTVLFVFLITRQIFSLRLSLVSSLFSVFTPGLIQSAHFGTTESLLTFFLMLSIYLSISCLSNSGRLSNLKFIFLASLTTGLAFGSKLTGLFCLFPVFFGYLIAVIRLLKSKMSKLKKLIGLLDYWFIGIVFVFLTIIFCILFSPYNLIDYKDFLGSVFGYEQDVATGRYEAFYTRQFTGTIPVIFQMQKVFPYALGWPVFILGSSGILLSLFNLLKHIFLSILLKVKKSKIKVQNLDVILILLFSFFIYLLPNAFLFAKWTRFMTPIFPFFAIFAGYFIFQLFNFKCHCERSEAIPTGNIAFLRDRHVPIKSGLAMTRLVNWFIGLLVLICLFPGLAFFSIYTRPDSRIQASKWIYENIPDKSYILSETANVIDIPLNLPTNDQRLTTKDLKVISFDFYHMDENPSIFESLPVHLEKADYILVPSRRIFANHMPQSDKYPRTAKYYQLLFSGRLGFEKVTEISSFPLIPDENAEETFTVFDHPVIRIYKKTLPFYREQYKRMMGNI